jgi:hypothetical protein
MHYNIPQHIEPQIQEVAQAQHISENEVLDRIFKAGWEQFAGTLPNKETAPRRPYASFFGAAKGPGTHQTREEVDRYIAELRNEW